MKSEKPSEQPAPFDISIWKRALIQNREKMNRRRRQTVEKVWKAMETLCNTYECSEVYIFGSAASSDHFSEMSDVDIGIGGLDKLSHYRFIADLSERIERDVDVVRLEDCSFADAIRTRGIRWKKNN